MRFKGAKELGEGITLAPSKAGPRSERGQSLQSTAFEG